MRWRTIQWTALTVAVLNFSGCGTINNMIVGTPPVGPYEIEPPLEVYGGIRSDLDEAADTFRPPYSWSITENAGRISVLAVTLADVPFSAIGDTLTLRQTVSASIARRNAITETADLR